MTTASPIRRALVDLPVNTAGTVHSAHRRNEMKKVQIGKKRPHWAIEDESENQDGASLSEQSSSKLRTSTTEKVSAFSHLTY